MRFNVYLKNKDILYGDDDSTMRELSNAIAVAYGAIAFIDLDGRFLVVPTHAIAYLHFLDKNDKEEFTNDL